MKTKTVTFELQPRYMIVVNNELYDGVDSLYVAWRILKEARAKADEETTISIWCAENEAKASLQAFLEDEATAEEYEDSWKVEP